MSQPESTLPRLIVPLAALVLAVGVSIAVFINSGKQRSAPPTPTPTPAAATPQANPTPAATTAPAPEQPAAAVPAQPPAATPSTPPAATPAIVAPQPPTDSPFLASLRAAVFTDDPLATGFAPLGDLDTQGVNARIEFSDVGAGVRSVVLANHWKHVDRKDRIDIQSEGTLGPARLVPFAALGVEISEPAQPGQPPSRPVFVSLARGVPGGPVWRQTAADQPGRFEALITDAEGTPVLRLTRAYTLRADSYAFDVRQFIENRSGRPLNVRWFQVGPIDLPEIVGYGGDKRRFRFGHLVNAQSDPSRSIVVSNDFLIPHATALGSRDEATRAYKESASFFPLAPTDRRSLQSPLWPTTKAVERGYELVFAGAIGRYFGVAIHPIIDPTRPDLTLRAFDNVGRIVLDRGRGQEIIALRLLSPTWAIAPGQTADISHAVYAGPLARTVINADPASKAAGLDGLVIYNFGGMCGPCTFEFLTHGLLLLLRTLHDYVFSDWSLAIIFLVVIVRALLHPVTRWSQIRMQRFGKQMQAMAPKQQKIQERYKDDRQKMQQETAKLWKEEGVSPAGLLGCIPMFLQMPIWIALYATLFFAQELRQQPAFYGVIQAVTGDAWSFLADLSEPDRAVPLGFSFKVPLVGSLMGPIDAINLLPLILGVVFFIHQKYITPPSGTQLTPEQELQQKMIKWMSVIMFPLFMYNAPSGLALYFTANSTFAIFENRWIRRHIDKHDLLNPEKYKKQRTPGSGGGSGGGFFARLQAEAQKRLEAQQQNAQRGGKHKPTPPKRG